MYALSTPSLPMLAPVILLSNTLCHLSHCDLPGASFLVSAGDAIVSAGTLLYYLSLHALLDDGFVGMACQCL